MDIIIIRVGCYGYSFPFVFLPIVAMYTIRLRRALSTSSLEEQPRIRYTFEENDRYKYHVLDEETIMPTRAELPGTKSSWLNALKVFLIIMVIIDWASVETSLGGGSKRFDFNENKIYVNPVFIKRKTVLTLINQIWYLNVKFKSTVVFQICAEKFKHNYLRRSYSGTIFLFGRYKFWADEQLLFRYHFPENQSWLAATDFTKKPTRLYKNKRLKKPWCNLVFRSLTHF